MSSNETKKKIRRKGLGLNEKLEILDRLNTGEPACDIALSFNIDPSTVSKIKSGRKNIEKRKEMLSSCQGNFKKKKFRGTEESLLESTVFQWMSDKNHTGAPISTSAIQQVAVNVHKNLNIDKKFTASPGWIRRFRDRHGISIKNMHGEKLSANVEASEAFKSSFGGLMKLAGVDNLDCVYNCDETALYWKLLPSKTLTMGPNKGLSGSKKSQSRITVMVCTNASGTHKIPLHIIGKFRKPRCLNKMNKCGIKYSNQSNALMNQEIMMDWYKNLFIPEVKKKHKYEENKNLRIILLMDNAPCHPTTNVFRELNHFCTIIFLPANTTSILHPMEQGVIEKFKRCYRNALLSNLLMKKLSNGFSKVYKNLQLSDAFHYSTIGWNEVSETDIRNCWKNLIPLQDHDSSVSTTAVSGPEIHRLLSILPGYKNTSVNDANKWLESDKYVPCFEIGTLIESPVPDNETSDKISKSETDSEYEVELECNEDVSLKEVHDAIILISRWFLCCDNKNLIKAFEQLKPFRKYIEKLLGNDNNK